MGHQASLLNVICGFSDSSLGYVIKFDTDNYQIVSFMGEPAQNDSLLDLFNEDLAKENKISLVKVKKLNSFKLFTEKYLFYSIAVIDYQENTKIVLFSKTANAYKKGVIDLITRLISVYNSGRLPEKAVDADGQKQLQELEKSEEKFRMLVNTANDLIFILNGFGYFSMVNKNGALALGYNPNEMIGKHFLEYIEPQDAGKVAEAFQRIINSDDVTTFEVNFIGKLNNRLTFEIQAKPLKTDGDISGMISIGRDISGRIKDEAKLKELNQKLIEANRIISIERERAKNKITVLEELNKLKSEFISNVSHELRTPLASIVGFAETILSDQDIPKETMVDFTKIILTEGKRLAKLINEILDFAKLESGEDELKIVTFNIVDLLEDVRQNFDKQLKDKEITLSTDYPAEGITLRADKDRIAKVITNLLSNAIKFNNKGGRITIITQDIKNEVELSISDTGIGIAEKDIPNLFQKFSKISRPGAQIPGAGFGLVLVKQIIELHKGLIKVTSELNKGTTIIIRLPK
jgi:PAS domain S-box-containing protein